MDPWLTLPATPSLPQADSSGSHPINGVEIWYALFSTHLSTEGPTVIFLHGGLGHSAYLGDQVAKVAMFRQVLSIDSRGHGRSSRDNRPYTYELMASDVIAVMDELHIETADVVGWSDGGIIGLVMARDHPSYLNSLYCFGANSDPSAVLDTSTSVVFNEYISRCSLEYPELNPNPNDFDNFLGNISLMWSTQPHFVQTDFGAMRSSISNPLWIVDGDHEEAITRSDTLFMADSNVQFGLVLLPRVSHFAFLQDPNTFTSSLLRWLDIDVVTSPASTLLVPLTSILVTFTLGYFSL